MPYALLPQPQSQISISFVLSLGIEGEIKYEVNVKVCLQNFFLQSANIHATYNSHRHYIWGARGHTCYARIPHIVVLFTYKHRRSLLHYRVFSLCSHHFNTKRSLSRIIRLVCDLRMYLTLPMTPSPITNDILFVSSIILTIVPKAFLSHVQDSRLTQTQEAFTEVMSLHGYLTPSRWKSESSVSFYHPLPIPFEKAWGDKCSLSFISLVCFFYLPTESANILRNLLTSSSSCFSSEYYHRESGKANLRDGLRKNPQLASSWVEGMGESLKWYTIK